MDPPRGLSQPTPLLAILLQVTEARNLLSPRALLPVTRPPTPLATPTTAHLTHLLIHHVTARVQAIPPLQAILQAQATHQLLQEVLLRSIPPPMHLPIPQPDRPPFKTQKCQVTPPRTPVCPHMRQEKGQDTLGQEEVEVILPRATLHREGTRPRREVRHRVTLQLILQEAETLLEQGTPQATPQLTPQVTLREERVTPQIGVGTLPLEHRQVEAALPATLPPTLLVELILPAIHLPILPKEVTLLATPPHTLPEVEKPQAIPPHMHQMKVKLPA